MITMLIKCPIGGTELTTANMVKINKYHVFDKYELKKYIDYCDLHIDINNATEEEWVLTATTDKFSNGTNRIRNPLTNLPFTRQELVLIFFFCSDIN